MLGLTNNCRELKARMKCGGNAAAGSRTSLGLCKEVRSSIRQRAPVSSVRAKVPKTGALIYFQAILRRESDKESG